MCKLRGIIWYIIHANRMLLKIWPHLTFGWPFVNISLTIHPTDSKLYDPFDLTSNLIYMKGHLKHFEMLTPIWPLRDPYWEGAKSSKILSKYFLTYNDFKTINNSFSSKWHLSTSSTTVFIFNTSKFARARWLYNVIVTHEVQWYSFWYQWTEDVHTYTLVANIGVSSIPYRKSREGVATTPLRRTCYKKYLRRTRANEINKEDRWSISCTSHSLSDLNRFLYFLISFFRVKKENYE